MTSERIQRQIDRLLDEAEEASTQRRWDVVKERADHALTFDPNNVDARALLTAAERGLAGAKLATQVGETPVPPQPTSFADGRYVVRRFLGEGGKKKVYLAHDARLDRDVAFALIKTEGLDEAARERITREAQAMGRLGNHPNIVTVYDIGDENGQPFMVLPVLEGGDVEGVVEKAEEHKLALERAIQIAVDTCQGLELAHSRGIVHRDLKPGNVWLTEDGRAMIGDFGLAVAVDRSRLTQAGMMVGTPNYMPPEQAIGGNVGPRSDLYSLGAMLYEMVCGRPPFVGDDFVAVVTQHLNTPPVSPTWHRRDCPPALETLILRLLAKDPEKRPASATEVREALQAVSLTHPSTSSGRTDSILVRGEPVEPRGADPLYRTVFVGREAELKQLQSAFDNAMSGQGGLVMVVGEPGIGKTALCEQLATYVSLRGGRTLIGHCYEEGSLPYLAFVEAMRTYVLARDADGLKSDLGTGAADVARIVSEVRDRVPVELRDASDPEDDRWRLLQSVTSFLRNASTVQPLVIVLEDLHWADRGTLDLLQHVARNLQGARLVIVGTYRDVEVDRSHPLSSAVAELRRSGSFLRLPLRGLTVDEVHRMYQAMRGYEVPWGQAELVHRQTEGNPLFVQEVLRNLVEEGIVVREQGTYVVRGDATAIPEGLRDVIGRRLSHLDNKTNTVLSVASVIGRDFRLDVLQKVAGLGEEDLYAALEEASERAIVEQLKTPSGVAFRFTHAMFRTLLYEEIFAPRRIRLHQQVGHALEEVHARRLEEHASELAEHFTQSTEAADLEKAVRYAELAAQRAIGVYAYGEAVRHYEQALRAQEVLDPDDKAKRCDLLLSLTEALIPAGEPLRAVEVVAEEAFVLAASSPSVAIRAARLADFAMHAFGGQTFRASPLFLRWAQRLDSLAQPGTAERALADFAMSAPHYAAGRYGQGRTLVRSALALARELGDSDVLARIAPGFAIQNWSPGDWHEVLNLAQEVFPLLRGSNSVSVIDYSSLVAFQTYLCHGERKRVDEVLALVSAASARTRHPVLVRRALMFEGFLAYVEGRLETALDTSERIVAQGEESGGSVAATWESTIVALWPLLSLGRADEALALLDQSGSTAEVQALPGLRALRPLLLASAGRIEEAKTQLALLVEERVSDEGDETPAPVIIALLEAAVLANDKQTAATLVDLLRELPPMAYGGIPNQSSPQRHLGAAAALLGKPDEARNYYAQALEVCEKLRFRPEIALIRLDLAELLLDHPSLGEGRDAAIDHLDFAIGELTEMKMQPALERALRHRGLLKA